MLLYTTCRKRDLQVRTRGECYARGGGHVVQIKMLVKDTAENLLHVGCGDEGIHGYISYNIIIVVGLNIDRVCFFFFLITPQ